MITSLIHSILQNKIANLCNIQLLNLQIFPINILTIAFYTLSHDQYMVLNKLALILGLQIAHKWPYFFITGLVRIGKSYIINLFVNKLRIKNIKYLLLAPIGVAANNINNKTIYSELNIMNSNILQTSIFQFNEKLKELQQIQTIIIDKTSIVSVLLFTFISDIFIHIHKNTLTFDAVNVIVSGDLAQLPPIHRMQLF
ncbi:9238_t:CDS:1 [Cetraspora pellucida]|uniref:ATP-dependent DNA helicase n=1 Tax=Cetraspora pellucida TaxID=1433469 RepID=A0A9N9G662_9GLOM|nr:9238_t:CDS:1 [Cetraspora pellucida]